MTGLLRRTKEFAKDVMFFGPMNTLDHQLKLRRHGVVSLNVPDVGTLYVRCGDSDYDCIRQTFRDGDYCVPSAKAESRIRARYEQILASGDTPVIVDAGANIGVASIWFKRLYPKATVMAIEPHPDTASVLRRNIAAFDGIHVIEAAIGSQPGFVSLMASEQAWGVTTVRGEGEVRIVTIGEVIAATPNAQPLIVKIDIEGFESDLFSENVEWLDSSFAVYIEPHDWMFPGRHTSASFQRAMGCRDFELYLIDENILYVRV
jgi:FkbM family methyltransferase